MLCKCLTLLGGKVTTKTVVNCFEKAGISKENQSDALLDVDNPFKDLQEQLDMLTPSSSQKKPLLMISSLWIIPSPAMNR